MESPVLLSLTANTLLSKSAEFCRKAKESIASLHARCRKSFPHKAYLPGDSTDTIRQIIF